MKRQLKAAFLLMVAGIAGWNTASAQDKFTVSGRADFVSNYVWRGSDQNSGFSVQPYLTLGYKGFSLTANGSQSLTHARDGAQEFDLTLGYSWKGLTVSVSDYWWNGMAAAYGHYTNGHHFEGTIAYSFNELCHVPLWLSWSTWFAGEDNYRVSDSGAMKRAYSTYICAGYDIALPAKITLTPSVGFTPWEGVYYKKAAFTDISLKASKTIALSDHVSLPLFVQAIVAPHDSAKGVDKTYMVAGFGFNF